MRRVCAPRPPPARAVRSLATRTQPLAERARPAPTPISLAVRPAMLAHAPPVALAVLRSAHLARTVRGPRAGVPLPAVGSWRRFSTAPDAGARPPKPEPEAKRELSEEEAEAAWWRAAELSNPDELGELMEHMEVDALQDSTLRTALHIAAEKADKESCALLIENGAWPSGKALALIGRRGARGLGGRARLHRRRLRRALRR